MYICFVVFSFLLTEEATSVSEEAFKWVRKLLVYHNKHCRNPLNARLFQTVILNRFVIHIYLQSSFHIHDRERRKAFFFLSNLP